MRYSFLFALCALGVFFNAPVVRAESLTVHTDDIMTHTALLPEPVASGNAFKLAATWWLPDWQGSQGSRGSTDDGGGDIVKDDSDCMEHYNLYETCPSPKVSTGIVHPVAGMTCQKGCICPSEYKYTSSNCTGEYQVSGMACDGKYNACSPKPCTSGGYYAEQQTDRICSAVTYGGRTCYSCYQPQCSAGGYETATNSGYLCSAVAYYGRTCYSCKNDTCPSGYGKSPCGSSHHQTGTAKTEAGSTCYACAAHSYSCPAGTQASTDGLITPVAVSKTCSCGAKSGSCYKEGHSHSYNCPSGYSATNSWGGSAQTVSKTCSCGAASGTCYKAPAHTHSYSCPSGYQSSCSSSQVQTGTTAKVCSCGKTSGTCYKCRKAVAGDILHSDGTISDSVIAGKTPVGIVAYVNGSTGFAVALSESRQTWGGYGRDVSCLGDMARDAASADMNGRVNTQCLVSDSQTHPAANYCNTFSAVSNGKGSSGWYLPAAGELKAMSYSYGAINLGLQKLSKTQISSNYYWSSSEFGDTIDAWVVGPSDDGMGFSYKDRSYPVRCVLAL